MHPLVSYLSVVLLSAACRSPVQPSPVCPEPEPVQLQCQEMLTHPIRQTYITRCVHPDTGEVTYH